MSAAPPQDSGGRVWTGPAAGCPSRGASPRLTVFTGPAGSGKSSVARAFAADRCAVYVNKDSLAEALVEELLHAGGGDRDDRDSMFYAERVMDLEYAGLLSVASDNLGLGYHVVLDAPFGKYLSEPDYIERMRAAHAWPEGAAVVVVEVRVSAEVRRERIRDRGLARDRWKLANWDAHESASSAPCLWRGVQIVHFDNERAELDLSALA